MSRRFIVDNPTGDDLEFDGELLVDENRYDIGRVQIWQTRGGMYVLRQKRATRPGRFDIDRTATVDELHELSEILGNSPGAKAVARQLGVPRTKWLE